ncbi:MAG: hypothetical protein JSS39_19645 [Nitrospira sp.]|nr:hypothetical protein [Nitrospira sp.]
MLEDDAHSGLSAFQESLPIHLIATGRAHFKTCLPEESLSEVIERNHIDAFDFLPVMGPGTQSGQTVAGILDVASVSLVAPHQTVRDHMKPLGEEHLIGANASILAFIRDADRHPFRFVVSGCEINGLVSISDLQRLPVRAALFAIVTQLEMTMAEVIRSRFPKLDDWMRLLSQGRAEKVRKKVEQAQKEDTLIDQLLYTEFCDKLTIINEAWRSSANESSDKRSFQTDMKNIQDLRDNLAHANNYAGTRKSAKQVCACVRKMDDWIRWLVKEKV